MIKIQCCDIEWETDGGAYVDLPSSAIIELEEDEELTTAELVNAGGADALSEQFGWLVIHYTWHIPRAELEGVNQC